MKTIITILLLSVLIIEMRAQPQDMSAVCKEEMKKLSYLIGDWKGEASMRGPGGTTTIQQTEHIEWKLNGLVLSLEGAGRDNEKIAFQAFALVNFDPFEKQFKLKSYVKEGYTTNAYFKILEENKFEWGFDIPSGGATRYTILLDPSTKTWYEFGEYTRDKINWMKFIELNLIKE